MRILHNLDNSNRGGIQELILRLHRHSRHVHEFWAADGSMAAQMRAEGMELWDGGPPADREYNVVVGHTVGGWSCNGVADFAHARDAKFVECMHSIAASPTNPAKVDGFIALSNRAMDQNPAMNYAHWTKSRTIYAPIDCQKLKPLPGQGLAIGRLSRLAEEKCPQEFARLAYDFPDETFLLAGDGPELSRISTMPNLFLPGWVTDLPTFYSQLKLFVFPTRDECCCVSVAQAQAAGVPVICADIPALRETTGGYAHFVNGHAEYVEAVRWFLSDPRSFHLMADMARTWAVGMFDLPVTVGKWDVFLETL